MQTLIVGPRGVGKSTLIRHVLAAVNLPVWGFETKKENSLADPQLGSPIYIYDAGAAHIQTPQNLVGYCKNQRFSATKEAFDRYGAKLRNPVPAGHMVLLDELGFMESASVDFCSAVLALLAGEAPAIAAVKDKDTPFLEAVRSHPNCRCFHITQENRDALREEVTAFVLSQLGRQ